jgi:hypothetical protein
MKKIVLIYGLIAGSILAAVMLISIPLWKSGVLNFDNGEITGYSSMVIALSMIFFGIKSYRDNHRAGKITFGEGFKVGIMIAAIASVMYALSWEVSYSTMGEQFSKDWADHYQAELESSDMSALEKEKAMNEMQGYMEWYKNPLIRFGMTLFEVFPLGLVITLISAALLRKAEFLSSQQNTTSPS